MKHICRVGILAVLTVNCSSGSTESGGSSGAPNSHAAGAGGGSSAGTGGAPSAAGAAPKAGAGGSTTSTNDTPSTVSIELIGALIGPGKSDGTQWDGFGTVPPDLLDAVAAAAGQPEIGPLLAIAQDAANAGLSAPDPYGIAEIDWDGTGFDSTLMQPLGTKDSHPEDTFEPTWPLPYPGWNDVAFSDGLKVRVTLYDDDLTSDDDIGVFTITADELLDAWRAGDAHWLATNDPNHQLLAVQFEVTGK